MKRLVNAFLQGLILLVPIFVTLYAFYAGFRIIDGFLLIDIPGIGALILISFVTAIGFVASTYFSGSVSRFVDRQFSRLPLAKLIYSAVKDLLSALVGDQKRFDRPVLVEPFPGGNLRMIGFVTREDLNGFELPGFVAVYFPQSYNFAGNTMLVKREAITPLAMDTSSVMAFIVSGGVSSSGTMTPTAI